MRVLCVATKQLPLLPPHLYLTHPLGRCDKLRAAAAGGADSNHKAKLQLIMKCMLRSIMSCSFAL